MSLEYVFTKRWRRAAVVVAFWPADFFSFWLRHAPGRNSEREEGAAYWLFSRIYEAYQFSASFGFWFHERLIDKRDQRWSRMCQLCNDIPGTDGCLRCGGTGSERYDGNDVLLSYSEWTPLERADEWGVANA